MTSYNPDCSSNKCHRESVIPKVEPRLRDSSLRKYLSQKMYKLNEIKLKTQTGIKQG